VPVPVPVPVPSPPWSAPRCSSSSWMSMSSHQARPSSKVSVRNSRLQPYCSLFKLLQARQRSAPLKAPHRQQHCSTLSHQGCRLTAATGAGAGAGAGAGGRGGGDRPASPVGVSGAACMLLLLLSEALREREGAREALGRAAGVADAHPGPAAQRQQLQDGLRGGRVDGHHQREVQDQESHLDTMSSMSSLCLCLG